MPKEHKERDVPSDGLWTLINPEKMVDLKDYCNEKYGVISHCYGYSKSYCPLTCSYAKERIIKIEEVKKYGKKIPKE